MSFISKALKIGILTAALIGLNIGTAVHTRNQSFERSNDLVIREGLNGRMFKRTGEAVWSNVRAQSDNSLLLGIGTGVFSTLVIIAICRIIVNSQNNSKKETISFSSKDAELDVKELLSKIELRLAETDLQVSQIKDKIPSEIK